jgi:spore photoproduct lyase
MYVGCSIGCSYCIMNGYLNYAPMVVQADVSTVTESIRSAALNARPGKPALRVGSGEVGDSLLLDPVFRLNEEVIRELADLPNVIFEMKSKTSYVDHLLQIDPKGRAVVAFSLNPPEIATAEEGLAAPPAERLSAARRCVEAGYRTAFHLDPVILTDTFPDDYLSLVSDIAAFPPASIAWVSLGTLRFPPALKDTFSGRPYARAEFVPSADGKLRYLQPVRREMYKRLIAALRQETDAPVYLCMESAAMWRYVAGTTPEDIEALAGVFR